MADEPKQPEAEASPPPKPGKAKTFGIFGGIMVVEGLAIFFAMKAFAPEPDPTMGITPELNQTTQPGGNTAELELARVRVQNTSGARTILYSVTANIVVSKDREIDLQAFLDGHRATINDVMSRILRGAEEKHLNEPGLETIKRLIRFEMNKLLGNETDIERVLISEFTPLPTGF